jgi:hypothetical protein
LKKYTGKILSCNSKEELKSIGKEITPDLKKKMTTNHVSELREKYLEAENIFGK